MADQIQRKATVLFDYDSRETNQLTIHKGEQITLIGFVTPENWILAKNAAGKEGYIPDKYFNLDGGAKPPPPPRPSTTSHDAPFVTDANHDSILMDVGDTYHIFAYQYEWFELIVLFICGVLAYMFGTTQPIGVSQRNSVTGCLIVLCCVAFAILISFQRSQNFCCKHPAVMRAVLLLFAGLFCIVSYPVGIAGALVAFIGVYIEYQLFRRESRPLHSELTNDWCAQIYGLGGLANCSIPNLIVFSGLLAVDIVALGWGFVDGHNYAIQKTDERTTNYYLSPTAIGMVYGFGRIITINACLLLIFSMFACIERQITKSGQNRQGDQYTCCQKILLFFFDEKSRIFVHRFFGYSIVAAAFLHAISNYFAYENSGPTHSYLTIYGWATVVTGYILWTILGLIVGSSNQYIQKQNQSLFRQTHYLSLFLIFLCIFHGPNGVGQYYWKFITGPIILYSCDLFYRYAKRD